MSHSLLPYLRFRFTYPAPASAPQLELTLREAYGEPEKSQSKKKSFAASLRFPFKERNFIFLMAEWFMIYYFASLSPALSLSLDHKDVIRNVIKMFYNATLYFIFRRSGRERSSLHAYFVTQILGVCQRIVISSHARAYCSRSWLLSSWLLRAEPCGASSKSEWYQRRDRNSLAWSSRKKGA
jgi:hypothetical protein